MKCGVITCRLEVLSQDEMNACLSVIAEGEAVDLNSAANGLRQAEVIAVARDGQDIVGVGAIKGQRPGYASGISEKSGFGFDENLHELGYVAVKESHRGRNLSREITTQLLLAFKARPIFATTSSGAMKRTLERAGFVQQGNEWKGTSGNQLSLWIKNSE